MVMSLTHVESGRIKVVVRRADRMSAIENGLLDAEELKEVLRQLVSQIQHLRVDQAVTRNLISSPTPVTVLETEKAAKRLAIADTTKLLSLIEAL
jgi:hypothetical protein